MNEHDEVSPIPADEPPMVRRSARPVSRSRHVPPPPPLSRAVQSSGGAGRALMVLFLLLSLGLNFILILALFIGRVGSSGDDAYPPINEKVYSGNANAEDKVAIIKLEGIILDEMMGYVHRQIDRAAKDPHVKAVVLRVNSPGGSVTASDELHRRLTELKNGNSPRYTSTAKKIVVSMGGMAASGGYYVSMPSEHIFAEETTTTGSIGVYISLPNVQKLANDHGVKMNLIKAGDVKASGSMFHDMTPQERQQWQDMVDEMYGHFLQVVEDGRPKLKGLLTKDLVRKDAKGKVLPDETLPHDDKGNVVAGGKPVPYKRKRADGGGFTAKQALEYGLIDQIGNLDTATKHAASLASLTDYKVVSYDRPPSLLSLFGADAKQPQPLDAGKLSAAVTPRLWYLAPNSEFAGLLGVLGRE